MTTPTPFQIHVPDSLLEQTKRKLSTARLPDQLEGVNWEDGTPVSEIERLKNHWLNNYDWRTHEAKINELPQFTMPIDVDGFGEMTVHFVHKRSSSENAIPLIFIHGWPGSFHEVQKILPLLTDPPAGEQAFHVVAPSLPGYCWSTNPTKKGFNLGKIAEMFNKLMIALDYPSYVAQGGDWGSIVTRRLGQLHPEHCRAIHVNMLFTLGTPRLSQGPLIWLKWVTLIGPALLYDKREIPALKMFQKFRELETGYQAIQGSKPQSLAYGLWDSPVGLLAWIREKLDTWTDNYPWTDDELITWVMLHWVSCITGGIRLYKEAQTGTDAKDAIDNYVYVPMGISAFPGDFCVPKDWARTTGNLKFYHRHDTGGHFAAWEKPGALVGDIREFFGERGGARGVTVGERAKL